MIREIHDVGKAMEVAQQRGVKGGGIIPSLRENLRGPLVLDAIQPRATCCLFFFAGEPGVSPVPRCEPVPGVDKGIYPFGGWYALCLRHLAVSDADGV